MRGRPPGTMNATIAARRAAEDATQSRIGASKDRLAWGFYMTERTAIDTAAPSEPEAPSRNVPADVAPTDKPTDITPICNAPTHMAASSTLPSNIVSTCDETMYETMDEPLEKRIKVAQGEAEGCIWHPILDHEGVIASGTASTETNACANAFFSVDGAWLDGCDDSSRPTICSRNATCC